MDTCTLILTLFSYDSWVHVSVTHQVLPGQRRTKGHCTSWPSEGSQVMNSGVWSSSVLLDHWWRWKMRGWTQSTSRSTSSSPCPDALTSSNSSCTTSGGTQRSNLFCNVLICLFCFQTCGINRSATVNYSRQLFVWHVTNSGKCDTLLFKPSFDSSFMF